jgi:RNA polymerase sigma-70 factor, ECF subfamily
MPDHPYVVALVDAAGADAARLLPRDELERVLQRIVTEARAAWPDLQVEATRFIRHLALHLPADAAKLAELRAGDLYLACACLDGDRRGLELFERCILDRIGGSLRRLDTGATFVDDVKQQLREKLFMPAAGGAKIAHYRGTGALEGWVRIAAIRTGRNLLRSTRARQPLSTDDAIAVGRTAAPDAELEYLRGRYASEFAEVFRAVLAEQPARDKNVLRLYFVDGLRSGAIGKIYGVHGATVRRWIERAREEMLAETRRRLAARLALHDSELESLMMDIHSQLDLTLSRCLRVAPADAG